MHDHAGHSHGHDVLGGKVFSVAVAINVLLTVVEVGIGLYAGSTALIADALHNLNDAAALVIAWWARRISRRQSNERFTFGYRRAELVAALINLTAIIVLALSLASEAFMRFFEPVEVEGGAIAIASAVAIVVDLGTAFLLWELAKGNLNPRAAFLHNLSDAGFSIAVLVGGLIVMKTGLNWIDPSLTLILAVLMIVPSVKMLLESARILMLGAPKNVGLEAVHSSLMAVDGVTDVHHMHLWHLDEENLSLEAHLCAGEVSGDGVRRILTEARRVLSESHGVRHSTLQVEPEGGCGSTDHEGHDHDDHDHEHGHGH